MGPERLGAWIDRLGGALTLYARQWSDAPEDAVQEAFLALATQHPSPADPASWLFRAVRNRAINAGIAGRRRRRREAEAAALAPAWFEPDPAPPPGTAVDPEAAQAALAALPEGQREAIVAHLWGGLTFEQVGALVGCSASSAHRLYHAGLASLRDRLGVSPCPRNPDRPTTV